MALQVIESQILAFDDNVKVAYEQGASRLRDKVDLRTNVVGRAKSFEVIVGNDTQREKGTGGISNTSHRHETHTIDDDDGVKAWAVLRYLYKAKLLDPDDEDKLLDNPKNKYVKTISSYLGRQFDSLVIGAAIGTSIRGEAMGESNTFPVGQTIGTGNTTLTVNNVVLAWKMLNEAEVPEEDRYLLVNARGLMDLAGAVEVSSADFNTQMVLAIGKLKEYCGFNFVRTELITNSTGCIAYHKDAIGAAEAEMRSYLNQRPDKHMAWQAYGSIHANATRVQNDGVVKIIFHTE